MSPGGLSGWRTAVYWCCYLANPSIRSVLETANSFFILALFYCSWWEKEASPDSGGYGEEVLSSSSLEKEAGEVHPIIFFMKKACSLQWQALGK